jgi:pyruvate dehydrogenase complex dehydrogenase (E1) component
VIAATDYMRAFAEQIRPYVPRRYVVLGTDGFGRSDTREKLRHFFEVDRYYVTVAALKALADEGAIPAAKAAEAMKQIQARPGQACTVDGVAKVGQRRFPAKPPCCNSRKSPLTLLSRRE